MVTCTSWSAIITINSTRVLLLNFAAVCSGTTARGGREKYPRSTSRRSSTSATAMMLLLAALLPSALRLGFSTVQYTVSSDQRRRAPAARLMAAPLAGGAQEELDTDLFSDAVPALGSAANQPRNVPAARLEGTGKPTVWSEFGALAAETGAVNLGQGFPDWQPPEFVVEQAHAALREGYHQYTRPAGHPSLVEVLATRYSAHLQRQVDPMAEVAITVGASQALYLTLQALIDPGDEVVVLEPAFDLYYGQIMLAGGKARPVALSADEEARRWTLDEPALSRALTPRTKLLILNSPHNPTGTVFTRAEMEQIAELVRSHANLLVISDEVYKYTVYGTGASHVHFASLPGMFDRTVTLSSAGKTFSITGWQAGWCVGPPRLIKPIQLLLPFVQFCVSTPMQQALSRVLSLAEQPYVFIRLEITLYSCSRRG